MPLLTWLWNLGFQDPRTPRRWCPVPSLLVYKFHVVWSCLIYIYIICNYTHIFPIYIYIYGLYIIYTSLWLIQRSAETCSNIVPRMCFAQVGEGVGAHEKDLASLHEGDCAAPVTTRFQSSWAWVFKDHWNSWDSWMFSNKYWSLLIHSHVYHVWTGWN